MTVDDENDNVAASKKAKNPKAPAAAAPTSFSLFDMLDSQKGGGFSLPPRIMAHQIIEMYQREKNDTVGNNTEGGEQSTTLELLEKAGDMEDLNPDPDAWEEIHQIL